MTIFPNLKKRDKHNMSIYKTAYQSAHRNDIAVSSLSQFEQTKLDVLRMIARTPGLSVNALSRSLVSKLLTANLVAIENRADRPPQSYLHLTQHGYHALGMDPDPVKTQVPPSPVTGRHWFHNK